MAKTDDGANCVGDTRRGGGGFADILDRDACAEGDVGDLEEGGEVFGGDVEPLSFGRREGGEGDGGDVGGGDGVVEGGGEARVGEEDRDVGGGGDGEEGAEEEEEVMKEFHSDSVAWT